MNPVLMTNVGLERYVPQNQVEHYQQFGWEIVGANQEPEAAKSLVTPVDSGTITARPPKKKTAKSAEIATEAATVDQGNDISKGD